MVEFNSNILVTLALLIIVTWAWKIASWLFFQPKKLEWHLRRQGLKGNPYRLWHGDLKDMKSSTLETQSKEINLHDDISSYAVPFDHHIIQRYGKLVEIHVDIFFSFGKKEVKKKFKYSQIPCIM